MVEVTEALVLDCLVKAASQEPNVAKAASEQLAVLATSLPYYRILAQLFPLPEVPHDVRLLCLLQLKQFVHTRWVARNAEGLSPNDRAWFRSHLLSHGRQTSSTLMSQLGVILGKVARADWPSEWPELLPTLMTGVEAGEDAALVLLVAVVKALASRRLPSQRQQFQRLTADLLPRLLRCCATEMDATRLSRFTALFRCLVRFGLRDAEEMARGADSPLCPLLRFLHDFLLAAFERGAVADYERVLGKMTRVLLVCQENLARAFVPHIPAMAELSLRLCLHASPPPTVLRNLLNLLHAMLTAPQYRPRIARGPDNVALAESARQAVGSALQSVLDALMGRLLALLCLSPEEAAEMIAEPEAVVFPAEAEQEWRFGVRAASHCLLLLLCTEFESAPGRLLLMVREAVGQGGLQQEAALGLLAGLLPWVSDEVSANSVCSELGLPLLASEDLLLRRRALWLLGEIADAELGVETLLGLLTAVSAFLHPQQPLLLRLQALRGLTRLLAALEEADELLEGRSILPSAFQVVLSLLEAVRETSTRIQLVQSLRGCVVSVRLDEPPPVGALWAAGNREEPLVLVAVLELTAEVIVGLGEACWALLPLLSSMLETAVTEEEETMLEAGLHLWLSFLTHAPLSPAKAELMRHFPRLLPHLHRCNAVTLVAINIAEAYVITCGPAFMQAFGSLLIEAGVVIAEAAEPSLADAALLLLDSVLRLFPDSLRPLSGLLRPLLGLPAPRPTHVRLLVRAFLIEPQFLSPAEQRLLLSHSAALVVHWSSVQLRRLMCVATCALFPLSGLRLEELTDTVLPAIAELEGRAVTESSSDTAALPQARKKAFKDDPVTVCALPRWLAECLNRYRQNVGVTAFEEELVCLDPVVRERVLSVM